MPQENDAFLNNLNVLGNIVEHRQWIIGEDFNIILSLEEKRGGIRRLYGDSEGFQKFIEDIHLIDIQTRNNIVTWSNRHSNTHQVACHLDRFLFSDTLMMEGLI